ncbi:MAG: alpha/beta hydrolase [Pseudomonadota bacterium]
MISSRVARLTILWFGLFVFATLVAPKTAFSVPGPLFQTELAALFEVDQAAALERLDDEIAPVISSADPDVRLLQTLFELKADFLQTANRREEAARTLVDLARLLSANRSLLASDPIPHLRRASDLLIAVGKLRDAERVLTIALDEATESGLALDIRKALLSDLADIAQRRGRSQAADAYRTARETLSKTSPTEDATRGDGAAFKRVPVFYATDRARSGSAYPSDFYGGKRGGLEYGIATVTIPATHKFAQIEAPSVWSFEFTQSSAKHIILKSVEPVEKTQFFERMRTNIEKRAANEAFVFIHGFNVSFEKAAKRAAQMAHDMSFDGLPILFSWPSANSVLSYISDTAVVRLSGRRLSQFLEDVVKRSGATRVHVIAHSMGNRALTDALELMALRYQNKESGKAPLDQVIFAAPDVDADLFGEMVKTIRPLANRLTLYASEEDWALKVSRKLHGDAPRAGQGGGDTLISPVVDSIDMSELGEDMLAHSYFAGDASALVDLLSLFWQNAAPEKRCGLEASFRKGSSIPIWRYVAGKCVDAAMLPLLAQLRSKGSTEDDNLAEKIETIVGDAQLTSRLQNAVVRLLEK